jgi:hypothetical protein
VYEVVLQEGRPADILAYVDGALLVDLWDDLVLPRAIRSAWTPVITASRGHGGVDARRRTGRRCGMADLTDFQLEVTGLFFGLPACKGFLLGGELPCSHSTSRHGPPKTWIASPPRTAATCRGLRVWP